MNFTAIDVETANADMSSICQIGIVKYEDGKIKEEWKSYVNPESYFDAINISIHGIDESIVEEAPTLPKVSNIVSKLLTNQIVVCHTHFDRVSISQAFQIYNLDPIFCQWLDSARVTRRTWDQFAWKGYGLLPVCEFLGYTFKHHDALEDAKAAGHILLSAINTSNLCLDDWLMRVEKPIDLTKETKKREKIQKAGNPEGNLYGEVLVFTDALEIPRREATEMASEVGCQVASGVNKNTTILIVGDQDIKRLAPGHKKSSKHRKVEDLISKGQDIRILRETDFKELIKLNSC